MEAVKINNSSIFSSSIILISIIALAIYFLSQYPEAWIIIVGIIIFWTSFFLMHILVGLNLFRITIPSFFWFLYLITIFFPAFYWFFKKPDPFRYTFLFSVESVLITIPLGILLANILFFFKKSEIKSYFEIPTQQKKPLHIRYLLIYITVLFVAIGFMLSYIAEVKTIPLFYMFAHPGESMILAQLRDVSFKVLDSPFRFAYHLLRDFLYPVLIMFAFGCYLYSRQRKWLSLFLGTLAIGLLYASFTLARLPPAAIFFLIFLFLYLFYGGKPNKIITLFLLFLFLVFPIVVLLFSQTGASVIYAVKTTFERIFLAPANILYYYYEIIPDRIDFLYGATMGKLAYFFGQEYFNIGNFVSRYINPSSKIETGSANVAFIGELYANFGIFGVLFGGIITGIIMQAINIYLIRRRKTIFNISVFAFLLYEFGLLTILPLTSVLIFSGVPILLFLLLFSPRGYKKPIQAKTNRVIFRNDYLKEYAKKDFSY